MTESNLNPHEAAQEELLKWEEQGIRHTFDPELVVLADIYPNKFYSDRYAKNNKGKLKA